MINPLHFQTFIAVYRTGSQTKAAEQLYLTQPTLSQHIKCLETQIGRKLFEKQGRDLAPTLIAHQLAMSISPHLDALNEIWEDFREDKTNATGTVYVGGIAEFFSTVIAQHLAPLSKQGIQIRFEITVENMLERLLSGELDLVQLWAPVMHPGVTLEKIFHEELYLVGAPSIAKQLKKPTGDDFNKLPWICYDQSLLFIKDYYQKVFNQSFSGKVVLMVKDLWSIEAAVVGGAGITVLPSYFCEKYLKSKKLVRLHIPKEVPSYYFYLAWKDGAMRIPKINKVREILVKAAGKMSL